LGDFEALERSRVDEQGHDPADLRPTAAERAAAAVLPACGAVWTAAEILHWAGHHPSGLWMGGATAFAAAVSWGASSRWNVPRQLPAWIAIAGGWFSAAVAAGPLAGLPHPPLTIAAAVIALVARSRANRHEAVTAARDWRAQRADWLGKSHEWGLGRTHLLDYEETRLGERYEIDTRGTGKRASAFAGNRGIEELIAEREGLAPSRVRIHKMPLAGRVTVSVRRASPWARPMLHPIAADAPEIDLPVPCSILGPVPVGQDPETGRPLTVPLFDRDGGKNLAIVSIKGGGKDVILDAVSERVTAATDAIQIRINLSVKGAAEADSWGPACHLTAFGPHQATRAVKVLKVIGKIIEWRAKTYKRGVYAPNPGDPGIVVIVNESDSAMKFGAVRAQLDDLATKAREYGVAIARAGQRGTADYSSAKARSQDDVFIVGKVNRDGEIYHAAGSMGFELPNMAEYGEGHPGVWAIALLGGGSQRGRGWVFAENPAAHGEAVARIAEDRAFSQPELPAACREYLGDEYEILLSTDVFAQWARERHAVASPPPDRAPQPAEPAAGASPAPSPVVVVDDTDISGTAALPKPPEVSEEAMARSVAERWRQFGEQTKMSENHRNVLIEMVQGDGTTAPAVAARLGVTPFVARGYLQKLADEGLIRLEGKGRGSRWRATRTGDSQ
jgi:hypothetical protein